MEIKKWPVLAQVLIALGFLGGLRGVVAGLSHQSILDMLFGIVGMFIFWNVYKLKPWALKALTVLISLNILFLAVSVLAGFPILLAIVMITLNGLIIYYFNSKEIKNLFVP
jgi:hypothetical protein